LTRPALFEAVCERELEGSAAEGAIGQVSEDWLKVKKP
jgi:hypothetical protein